MWAENILELLIFLSILPTSHRFLSLDLTLFPASVGDTTQSLSALEMHEKLGWFSSLNRLIQSKKDRGKSSRCGSRSKTGIVPLFSVKFGKRSQ